MRSMKLVYFLLLLLSSSVAIAVDSKVVGADVAPLSQSNLRTFGHDAVDASVVLGTITRTRTFTFIADPRTQRPCPDGLLNAARSPSNTETEASSGNVTTIAAPGSSVSVADPTSSTLRASMAIFLCNPQLPSFEKDRDHYRAIYGEWRPHRGRGGGRDEEARDQGDRRREATTAAAVVDNGSGVSTSSGDVRGTVVSSTSGASSFGSGSTSSINLPATISAVMSLANPQSSCNSVPVPISALDYVGMRLDLNSSGQPRSVYCVQANNDTQAHSACGGDTGGYSPINPGNPQYGITDEGDSNNTRRTNSAGYYFCVSKAPDENIKQEICSAANMPGFRFRWVQIGGAASRDGNCECREESAPDVDSSYSMNCSARDLNRTAVAAANAQADSAAQPVNPVAPTPDNIQTFQACVDRYKQNAQDCKNNADQANRICDPSNVRVEGSGSAGQVAGAAGSLASVYTQLNSGSGSQASCFNAGLLANAARITAQQSNEQCTTGISACHSQCTENQYDNFRTECAQKLGMTPDQLSAATTAQAQTYRTESANIQQLFQQGHDVCENQAAPKSNNLNNMLSGVGNALQGSLRCACQLSSSATVASATTTSGATQSGCNPSNIPNVKDCAANPALSGCQVYTELSVCTPGSTYNAALCRCQTNPSAGGCADVPTTGTLASMAGSAIKAGATASVDGFTSPNLGSATAPQNLDLSGEDSAGASLDATAKAGAAGSRQPYVGGGDGGAGGGGTVAANAEGGAAAADKDGIIGGLMNAIKTGARALGFGKDKGNGTYGSSDSGALGRGAFKPRGIAGGRSGIGSRNMEIWTMMNKCVQAETCPSNSQQYILTP